MRVLAAVMILLASQAASAATPNCSVPFERPRPLVEVPATPAGPRVLLEQLNTRARHAGFELDQAEWSKGYLTYLKRDAKKTYRAIVWIVPSFERQGAYEIFVMSCVLANGFPDRCDEAATEQPFAQLRQEVRAYAGLP